jgi:TonB family protein
MLARPLSSAKRRNLTVAILALFLTYKLAGQAPSQPIAVDGLTASQHWIAPPSPVYPMHAKQLHIQGSVALEVIVDPSGKVASVRVLSGPQELQQAAIDAYTRVKFRPFLNNGKPASVVVSTKINFDMNEPPLNPQDQPVANQYFELHTRCEQLSETNNREALNVCLQAVETSRKLPPTLELESRAVTYNDAAKLLVEAGRANEAEALSKEIVPLVAPAGRTSQATVNALMTRAEVRIVMGNPQGALDDLNEILNILQELKSKETSPVFIKMFQRERVQMLHAKAQTLRQMGRKAEAQQVDKETSIN